MHLYRSPWQQTLAGPLVAPRCLGTGEDAAAPLAWIAMADEGPDVARSWPLPHFATLARHLGEFNGAHPATGAAEDAPWLSRNWLEGWAEQSREAFVALPAVLADDRGRRVFARDDVTELSRAWDQRSALLGTTAGLPQLLSHNDGTPRNVLVRAGRSVAVDWGFCGWAPVGQQLSALVVGTQSFMGCPPHEWDALEQLCFDAHLDGLRSRWEVDEATLRAGYLTSTALRFVGLVAPIVELLKPGYEPLVELTWGTPFDRFVDNAAAMVAFYVDRIRAARALLEI